MAYSNFSVSEPAENHKVTDLHKVTELLHIQRGVHVCRCCLWVKK